MLLAKNVLPGLIAAKAANGEALRLWVLGCATGEEAYSLAILLREALDGVDDPPDVRLFATDIDARALAVARTGRYAQSIEAHVSPERLARWFVREGGTYCVHKDLREMCIFSAHNIVRDAPFSRIDLISCRNLLIYLKSELQDRVIPLFHFALRPNGCLFLGPSENVSRHGKLFQPIGRKASHLPPARDRDARPAGVPAHRAVGRAVRARGAGRLDRPAGDADVARPPRRARRRTTRAGLRGARHRLRDPELLRPHRAVPRARRRRRHARTAQPRPSRAALRSPGRPAAGRGPAPGRADRPR